MQLVEQNVIGRDDPRYAVIDAVAFASKNLYNAALYEMRQAFIHEGKRLFYNEMAKRMKSHKAYKALPAKVAQQVLIQLDKAWTSFFDGLLAYKADPSKFLGRPKLPKYKHKTDGRNLLIYTIQAISGPALRQGIIKPSMLPITIKTKQTNISQVRVVPQHDFYVIEVVYKRDTKPANLDPALCASIDIGVTNLAAIASNKKGFIPRLVNGRRVKAWNQWYNMRIAELKHKQGDDDSGYITRHMKRVTNKRTRRINHFLHTASRRIIDLLVKEGIGTLIIGKNDGWKQETNMGEVRNQNFVCIPHARFIEMLCYKAELVGIRVEITEESYTSQASFLDLDPIPVYNPNEDEKHRFSGKRMGRRNRLYRARNGQIICADVNGAYNVLRKRRPEAFAEGVAGYVVHPIRLTV